MMIRLQHTRPDGEIDTYHLKPGRKYHLGRGSACEVRILDLKLSRKHCVIEFTDGKWHVEDLCSTNGCRVNQAQIVGQAPIPAGTVIEIGQSSLLIEDVSEEALEAAAEERLSDSSAARRALPQEELPESEPGEHPRRPSGDLSSNDWEPAPESESLVKTGALLPNRRPGLDPTRPGRPPIVPRVVPVEKVETPEPPTESSVSSASRPAVPVEAAPESHPTPAAQAVPAPTPPAAPAPIPAATGGLDLVEPAAPPKPVRKVNPVTIRVGRVDGAASEGFTPLSTPALGDPSPAAGTPVNVAPTTPAAPTAPQSTAPSAPVSSPAPAPAPGTGGIERTFFITVLGKRVGPLTRSDARDLKARELKGSLTPADLDAYPTA